MRRYKYYIGGLEYMANMKANFYENYILVFKDGTQKLVNEATPQEVSHAISIIRIKDTDDSSIKNP